MANIVQCVLQDNRIYIWDLWRTSIVIDDTDIAKYAMRHLRFFDRFNKVKVTRAIILTTLLYTGQITIHTLKVNWKFFDPNVRIEERAGSKPELDVLRINSEISH